MKKLASIIAVLSVLFIVSKVQATNHTQCVQAPANLVGWWDGDAVTGTTAEDIQNSNDGTLVNGATTATGKVGDAFSFDNVNDYLQLPTTDMSVSAMTIDLWFNLDSWTNFDDLVQHSTDNFNRNRISLERGNGFSGCSGDRMMLLTGNPAASLSVLCTTTSFSLGTWYHVAASFDSSGNTKIYVNGVLENSAAGQIVPSVLDSSFYVGFPWGSQSVRYFDGLIDEVEIFDRVLTDAEVLAIYNADTAGKCKEDEPPGAVCGNSIVEAPEQCDDGNTDNGDGCDSSCQLEVVLECTTPPSDLVAWWDADDIVGNTAVDVSGNGNDGTIGTGASAPNIVPGKVGNAFEFFQMFSLVESSGFGPGGIVGMNANTGTIDMWAKPNWDGNDGLRHGLFHTTNNDASPDQFSAIKESDNILYLVLKKGGVETKFGVTATSVFTSGQWVHLAFTWNSTLAAIYADGVLVASLTNPSLPNAYSSSVPRRTTLGRLAVINTKFDGLLDEVEFFSRSLSISEIQSIFNADTAGKCKEDEPPSAVCGNSVVEAPEQCDDGDTVVPQTCGVGACQVTVADTCGNSGSANECTTLSCVPGTPTTEVCDGIDNDCDGEVDEDASVVCSTACGAGVQQCVNGALTACDAQQPETEICDSQDNDCDGSTDEDFPTLGTVCSAGVGECSEDGVIVCALDLSGPACNAVPGEPSEEVCDGLDNDCDASVDEGVDTDNDEVNDCSADQCLDSTADNIDLNPNQYGQNIPFGPFEVGPNNDQSVVYDMTTTSGCTCSQIVDILGAGKGHLKKGCSPSIMEEFTGINGQPDRKASSGKKESKK